MPQIFPKSFNLIARVSILGAAFGALALGGISWAVYRSPWVTRAQMPIDQVVPFSHKHHVSDDGIDCRYCHTTVETSAFAGIPDTKTCMTCHSILWKDAPLLTPVRASYSSGKPLRWIRVDDLPEFVFFNHSIHIAKGVGCNTCHGRVDEMPLTRQVHTLHMRWCLSCHDAPEKFIRPRSEVFDMAWTPPANQVALGRRLIKEYGINVKQMTDCVTCHR
jgi:hypothetical protein